MRLTNEMNFPHPVLAAWRDDFVDGKFDVEIEFDEDTHENSVELRFQGRLDSDAIQALIRNGDAMLGCFVVCRSTGLLRLIELGSFPAKYNFSSGELLDTVFLRPLVWTTREVPEWNPSGVNAEFECPQPLRTGDIVAMGEESSLHVSQVELPALETIFELKVSENLLPGAFEIDLRRDRITILTHPDTKHLIDTLCSTTQAAAATIMNSLYIPAIMTVLAEISVNSADNYVGFRWCEPFVRSCENLAISPSPDSLFNDAQRLLETPFLRLGKLAETEYG